MITALPLLLAFIALDQENSINLPIILAIAGSVALLIGLFGGGIKAKEIEVPTLARGARILSSLVGMLLIGAAIQLSISNGSSPGESPLPAPIPPTESAPTQIPSTLPVPTKIPTDMSTPTQTSTSTPTNTLTFTPSPSPTPPPVTFEVFANQSWQASGVFVKNGDTIQVTYITGQWRVASSYPFTDPLGAIPGQDLISDPECLFPMLPSVAGNQALITKIGENGESFNPFKRIRMGEGMLYLRLNDCDKYLQDNSGSVTVRIQLLS